MYSQLAALLTWEALSGLANMVMALMAVVAAALAWRASVTVAAQSIDASQKQMLASRADKVTDRLAELRIAVSDYDVGLLPFWEPGSHDLGEADVPTADADLKATLDIRGAHAAYQRIESHAAALITTLRGLLDTAPVLGPSESDSLVEWFRRFSEVAKASYFALSDSTKVRSQARGVHLLLDVDGPPAMLAAMWQHYQVCMARGDNAARLVTGIRELFLDTIARAVEDVCYQVYKIANSPELLRNRTGTALTVESFARILGDPYNDDFVGPFIMGVGDHPDCTVKITVDRKTWVSRDKAHFCELFIPGYSGLSEESRGKARVKFLTDWGNSNGWKSTPPGVLSEAEFLRRLGCTVSTTTLGPPLSSEART